MRSHKLTHAEAGIASQKVEQPDTPSLPELMTLDTAIGYLKKHGATTYQASKWAYREHIELFAPAWSRAEIRVKKSLLDEFLQGGRPNRM